MTIIAILIAFALCHFIREVGRMRRHEWIDSWVGFCNDAFNSLPGWKDILGYLVLMIVPLIALSLVGQALTTTLGVVGGFLLALAVLIYSFGPRDLDTDVAAVIEAESPESSREKLSELLGQDIPDDETERHALTVEAVFSEALRRWFAVIFWFAVLGVIGAFLYRLVDQLVRGQSGISEEQRQLFRRTQQVMDWPVAQLMTLALAVATDFDSVHKAWKKYHDELGHGLFEGDNGFLLASASVIVLSGHAARDGYADQLDGSMSCLKQAMDLVWRVLGVWLTLLALLLLVGVMA